MSSQNYFDLLGDDENEEPTAIIARATLPSPMEKSTLKKLPTPVSVASPVRLSTKPPQPTEAVKEFKPFEGGRAGRGGGRGGRGGGRASYGDRERESGYHRETRDGLSRDRVGYSNDRNFNLSRDNNNNGSQGNRGGGYGSSVDGAVSSGIAVHGGGFGGERAHRGDGETWSHEGSRGRGRGVGRGRDRGVGSDVDDRLRRREFDRRSGSGFGYEIKRDGSGRGNWGSEGDQTTQQEAQDVSLKEVAEKAAVHGEDKVEADINVEDDTTLAEDVAPKKEAVEDDNELTLDEYEKILESKRKALLCSKTEERKVQADKAFASMQLVDRKNDESVFIKLGSEKEKKKKEKEALDKEEKAKKTQSINEFLKPADGEKYYGPGGNRSRGRGRGGRGGDSEGVDSERVSGSGGRGNFSGGAHNARRASAPRIEDPGQFPNLGAK